MTAMNFIDNDAELTGVQYTDEGFLVGVVKCARTGTQDYHASEVGMMGDGIVKVNRSEREVFSEDSRKTYSHKPITMGHPDVNVTAENWDELAVGEVSTEVKFDNGWVHVPIIVKAADAIAKIKAGVRQISMGYSCVLATNDGQLEQTQIKINHLAFVDKARAGNQARIGDSSHNWGASPITEGVPIMEFKTVVFGDKAVKIAVDDAQGFEASIASLNAGHVTAIEAKDTAIGELKGKLADAEKNVLSDADIDARVTARATLVDAAKAIKADLVVDGKSDADIRKEAVAVKFGDDAIKDASDAEISGMFKAAMASPKVNDKVRKALGDGVHVKDSGVFAQIETNNGWTK